MTSVIDAPLPAAGVPAEASGARGYYNISEAAALLGVSRVSIWRWIRAGQLPAARLGHRTIRIKRGDLEQLLEQVRSAGSRAWTGRKLGTDAPAASRANSGRAFAA